jgi:hypothetical protein
LTGRAARWRLALWLALVASWLVTLPYSWRAFATVPSAERLARSRLVEIPTLQTLFSQLGTSALELGVLLALLWPWSARRWLLRLWTATLGLLLWFLATPPLGLSNLSWVRRRWLAAVALLLFVSATMATISVLTGRRGAAGRTN